MNRPNGGFWMVSNQARTKRAIGTLSMTTQVQEILHTFDLLPEGDKRELATEILRRSLTLDSPPLPDEQLVGMAEDVFLELDRR